MENCEAICSLTHYFAYLYWCFMKCVKIKFETSHFHKSLISCPIFIKLPLFCSVCILFALYIKIGLKMAWTFPFSKKEQPRAPALFCFFPFFAIGGGGDWLLWYFSFILLYHLEVNKTCRCKKMNIFHFVF